MSSILDKATQHFQNRVSGVMEYILVPEWSEDKNEPLKIYFKPMNLIEQNKIYKYVTDGSLESLVETLIVRSRNEDGSKMFKPVERSVFMHKVDPKVITRICNEMSGDDENDGSTDDAVKN